MPRSPFITAGAQDLEALPSAGLHTNRFFSGLWTQRSPMRDAAVPDLYEKFYSASRFESLIDGLNMEMTTRLTLARRPGCSEFNSNTFPAANSFYSFKYIQNNVENIRIIYDGVDGNIYDATPGQKSTLYAKAAGAGAARFLSVGTELFFGDGVEQKKILRSSKTHAVSTAYNVGDFFIDPNGNIQSFQSQTATLSITGIAVVSAAPTGLSDAQTFLVVTLNAAPPVLDSNQPVAFAGLTTYTALNGKSLPFQNISPGWGLNLAPNQIAFKYNATVSAQAADTGTATTFITQDQYGNPLSGTTAATAPASWSATQYGVTADGTVNWMCFGSPVQDWQVAAPSAAPTVQPTAFNTPAAASNVCNYWRPNMKVTVGSTQSIVIIDSNGQLQTPAAATGGGIIETVYRPTASSTTATPTTLTGGSSTPFEMTFNMAAVPPYILDMAPSIAAGLGVPITAQGCTPGGFNGTFWVTGVTATSVTVQSVNNPGAMTGFGTIELNQSSNTLNPGNAYDSNPSSFAEVGQGNLMTRQSACVWSGIPSHVLAADGLLTVSASFTQYDGTLPPNVLAIFVSLDGGATWTTLISTTSSLSQAEYTMVIPSGTSTDHVLVQAIVQGIGFFGTLDRNILVYDINIGVGSFTPGTSQGFTGGTEPIWNTSLGGITKDNQVNWVNLGTLSTWLSSYQYPDAVTVLIDTNGNLQYTNQLFQTETVWTAGVADTTGAGDVTSATQPTWSTTLGAVTSDNAYSWVNLGPASQLTAGTLQYAQSYHCIDGSVTTASPVSYALKPLAGSPGLFELQVLATPSGNTQVDEIWLWRTAGGQATLVFLDAVPNNPNLGIVNYLDCIPDTTSNGQQALIPEIPAPDNNSADPPPVGLLGPVQHMERIWGFVGNVLQWSGGPDTITGNGNTAWPPLNEIAYKNAIVKLVPVTVENGGLLVFTTNGIEIVLGTGTASNPFYTTSYCKGVNLANFNALDVLGSLIYLMEANGKVSSITIQYPFNPQSGYSEVGIPIGDQFLNVTTGGISSALYTPANAYLSWCWRSTADTGLYVADGAMGWFRMNQVAPPETGEIWSPRAAIAGGTSAVQSIETSPGIPNLLIAPPTGTPGTILMRDSTTSEDNGTPFALYATLGSIVLAQPGSSVALQYVVTEEAPLGLPCAVGVLLDEVAGTFDNLVQKKNDPPNLPASTTVTSQRFWANQNAHPLEARHMQTKISWPAQNFANELWTYSIYGRLRSKAKK